MSDEPEPWPVIIPLPDLDQPWVGMYVSMLADVARLVPATLRLPVVIVSYDPDPEDGHTGDVAIQSVGLNPDKENWEAEIAVLRLALLHLETRNQNRPRGVG